ncbi:porphobilinogen synthase [Aquiflexum sp.]|uniref:porphobilinogen synthase n=1 Tax=Aquiflexum sp. TaxID=1872584 RepID=UPI003593FB3C
MLRRPRRNRKSQTIRNMVEETRLSVKDFIFPMFLIDGVNQKIEVASMPGIFRYSLDLMLKEIGECMELGIMAFDIFPAYPESKKDRFATESHNPETFYLKAIHKIKITFPEAVVMTDVAMDPYSSDGHDGLVENGRIMNDETLEILAKMSLAQARAGADILGPSDMMDGRVGFIRSMLDDNGFNNVSIMSYTAKYASAFYGPFRDALDSAPKMGDKKTYQMDPANYYEALIEADLDTEEGADFLMVKPALAYLDVIRLLKDNSNLPIAAYNVSGEYAMIKASAQRGWLDGERAMLESLLSIKRAGANVILSYFAKEFAQIQIGKGQ